MARWIVVAYRYDKMDDDFFGPFDSQNGAKACAQMIRAAADKTGDPMGVRVEPFALRPPREAFAYGDSLLVDLGPADEDDEPCVCTTAFTCMATEHES